MGSKKRRSAADAAVTSKVQNAATTQEPVDHPADKNAYYWKDTITKFIVLVISIVIVQLSPTPPVDVIKPPTTSFSSLFFSGKLDHVPFITQMFVAAVFSLFFDIFVVTYHLANPPHPKYVMLTSRKISIYTHLIAGVTEIVSGVLAFSVSDHDTQRLCATVVSIASIVHSMTAYYQTAVVFGAKGVMVPGYLYAVTIHITNAFRLYKEPSSLINLSITFLELHIYVWCRVFMYIFRLLSAFNGYHYTISITLSGVLLFPYALGPVGNFNMLFICSIYVLLQVYFVGANLHGMFVEHERYALVTASGVAQWKDNLAGDDGKKGDRKKAEEVFASFDKSGDGVLQENEVKRMVGKLPIPKESMNKVLASAKIANGTITLENFYRYVWNFGSVRDRIKPPAYDITKKSEEEQATFIFNELDLDHNGSISLSEIEVLLTQWGMPDGEASSYLAKYGGPKKEISKKMFFEQMRPIWKFGVTEVVPSPARQGPRSIADN